MLANSLARVKVFLTRCRRLFKSGIVVGAKVEALRENRKLGFQASGSLEAGVGEESPRSAFPDDG